MIRYVLGRLASVPLTLLVVSMLAFSLVHWVPGDAVDVLGGENLDDAGRAVLRHQLGLDQPLPVQFIRWTADALRGDFGTSISTHRPVTQEIVARLGTTVELAIMAIIMALCIGIVGGAAATRWRNRWPDWAITVISTVGVSVPNYFIATCIILGISLYLPSLGVVSYVPINVNVFANLRALLFPALSLAIVAGCAFCRYIRASTEEILRCSDFIRTARAKGVSESAVLTRHILPNALIPMTTVAGLQFAHLVGGTVVIETVFALPGIGQLMIAAIAQRDYPLLQGCVAFQTLNFVVLNLLIDLLYPLLDPRMRSGMEK